MITRAQAERLTVGDLIHLDACKAIKGRKVQRLLAVVKPLSVMPSLPLMWTVELASYNPDTGKERRGRRMTEGTCHRFHTPGDCPLHGNTAGESKSMTLSQARETLNHYGRERARAHGSSMDWYPDAHTRQECDEARRVVGKSTRPSSLLLTVAGDELYQSLEREEGGNRE